MEFLRPMRVVHGRRSWSRSTSRAISSDINNKNDEVIPVLIVGAGTVGLVLCTLLRKLGIKCLVLERNANFSQHPRAHFINIRSMEIFRKLDGLEEEIQASQPPVDLWRKFIYCTSLSGSIIGSVDHIYPQDFDHSVSPSSVAHFSQHKLNRLLLKKLENLGSCYGHVAGCKSESESTHRAEILLRQECVHVESRDCINVTVRDFRNVHRKIRCRFLVAADGAGSTVRKLIGINMFGERNMQELVSIHFISHDIGRYLLTTRPGMLFFVFNQDVIGVLVAHDLEQGEFVLQLPFYPPQQKIEDFNFERCKRLISKLAGVEVFDLIVVDVKPWVMHAEVAEKFMSPDNRIILIGDAAHRFPPAGGFGMNTGIQDAHNLAWKLAAVLGGTASPSLLRTYETERRPIALFNTMLSVKNFKAAMEVPTALGLNPVIADSVHAALKEGIGSVLPQILQKVVLEGIFSLGRRQLSDSFLNETNIIGSSRLAKARRIFDEGRSLQLQFPAEDIGFRYLQGAVVANSGRAREREEVHHGGRRDYVPSAEPGGRLPHMKLKPLDDTAFTEAFSTLDMVRGDRVEFVLMIAPLDESYGLARTAVEVVEGLGAPPVRVCVVWPQGATGEGGGGDGHVLNVVEAEGTRPWWELCGMSSRGGAILVRPDDHIAWLSLSSLPAAGGRLRPLFHRIFSTLLGRS